MHRVGAVAVGVVLALLAGLVVLLATTGPPSERSSPPPTPDASPGAPVGPDALLAGTLKGLPERGRDGIPEGWPTTATTGVPAGVRLASTDGMTVTEDGTVLDGLDIDGCVQVRADDVVLRRSRIRCDERYAIRLYDVSGLVVEDVEIDGAGVVGVAVCCGGYTLRRVNIHDVVDGPRLGDQVVITDSIVHRLERAEGSHNDTLQSTGGSGVVVRSNTLLAWRPDTNDPFNASLQLGSEQAERLAGVVVEGNYMNGGNYTVNVRPDTEATHVVLRNNLFGRDHRYGATRALPDGVLWGGGNVYVDNGAPVLDASE